MASGDSRSSPDVGDVRAVGFGQHPGMATSVEPPTGRNGAEGAPPPERTISRTRLILVDVLIWLTTVLLIVGIFAVWANRQMLNPDNWSKTSTQLLQKDSIRSAAANYAVDQLYANVDIAAILKSELPTQLQGLAGPVSGALRNAAVQGAELALSRPLIQNAWAKANRAANQALVTIVNGGKGAAQINGGTVTLDLTTVVDDIASRLGLSSNIASKLPPSAAKVTLFKSDQLKFIQDIGSALTGLALALTIIVPLLYALAIVLASGHRRRTLMTVGFAIVFGGVLTLLARRIVVNQVTGSLVSDASLRPAVRDAAAIGTGMLSEVAGACVIVGLVVVVAAWFAGPARAMTAARRAITPFLRDHADWTFGLTAVILALIFLWQPIPATGTPAGIIVFSALGFFGVAMLRRQVIEEFPDARAGETMAALRTRVQAFRDRRHHTKGNGVSEDLERLAALYESGSITTEEYESAKGASLGRSSRAPES